MSAVTAATASLDRRLGLGDAVLIGLGSMVGAGAFAAYPSRSHKPPVETSRTAL
jgi:hypothetical protein